MVGGPAPGALYGRDTLSWQLNSKWFVLLGGPRAAILQICDPRVAAGVAAYSTYRTDPLGRLERTLDAMLTISFGSPTRRREVLESLEHGHSRVKGITADGEEYDALDPELMYWVLATLVDTTLEVERRYIGRLRRPQREVFFEESKHIARAFGVPDHLIPEDLDAFRGYVAHQFATLEPSDASIDITRHLMHPGVRWIPDQSLAPLNWITAELLPPRLRKLLRVADLNGVELTAVRSARMVSRTTLPLLGDALAANPLNGRAIRRAA